MSLTTRELRPGPLLARRLGTPAVILAATAGLVWLFPRLGIPVTGTRIDPVTRVAVTQRWGAVAIGIAAVFFGVRLLDYLVFDVVLRRRGETVVPALLRQLIGLAVFLIGVSLVFKTILAVSLTALLATSAIITAVIGLALQDTLGNLFAGLALHLEKSLRVGDMLRAGETYGTVEELSWRTIKLRTLEGHVLLVPNALAGRERLEIFPRPGRPIARALRVGLDYDASPERAREALESAMRSIPGIVKHPAPVVYLRTFDDHAITYEVRYWLDDYARLLEVDSKVRERVWYSLDRAISRSPTPSSASISTQPVPSRGLRERRTCSRISRPRRSSSRSPTRNASDSPPERRCADSGRTKWSSVRGKADAPCSSCSPAGSPSPCTTSPESAGS
jgi:small-conductance mechanosensitive channel